MTIYKVSLCSFLVVAFVTAAAAADLNQALTNDDVLCDAQQLERLAARMVVSEVDPGSPALASNPMLLLWRHPLGKAAFGLLAVTDGVRPVLRDERQLSAELVFGEKGDILDPRRPLLPHATLARRNQNSNLATNAREFFLNITMDVALEVPNPTKPTLPLNVNNLVRAVGSKQPRQAADAVGRGPLVDGLTSSCHSKLTDFDERIFRILSRALRITTWFTVLGYNPADPKAWNIVLHRGEDPHLYLARVYGYRVTCLDDGRCPFQRLVPADLEVTVNWDTEGRLTTGEIRLIPGKDSDVLAIFLLPPMYPGRDRQTTELRGAPFLRFDYEGAPSNILAAPVDWEVLLAGSRWNE